MRNTWVLFFSFYFIISIPSSVLAEHEHGYDYEYQQKLILLEGKNSRLMRGERRPMFNFNKKAALPYFLARGWKIQHVYVNEASTAHNIYGYAVIEKLVASK